LLNPEQLCLRYLVAKLSGFLDTPILSKIDANHEQIPADKLIKACNRVVIAFAWRGTKWEEGRLARFGTNSAGSGQCNSKQQLQICPIKSWIWMLGAA